MKRKVFLAGKFDFGIGIPPPLPGIERASKQKKTASKQ
jgi:hypothetical protein